MNSRHELTRRPDSNCAEMRAGCHSARSEAELQNQTHPSNRLAASFVIKRELTPFLAQTCPDAARSCLELEVQLKILASRNCN